MRQTDFTNIHPQHFEHGTVFLKITLEGQDTYIDLQWYLPAALGELLGLW